ncbi:hypothetical protein J7K43_04645 [Candidatus Calescamantes bacterium]|nr:hypothetical protein [Candidatus Calescamantes bacterium]
MKGKIIGLVIIILIALGFIVKQVMPKKYTYETVLIDTEAKILYKTKIPAGTKFPIKSPYSKKKTAYPAYRCRKCGAIFPYIPPPPPKEGEEIPPEYGIPKCPSCGSLDVEVPRLPEGKDHIKLK